MEGIIKIETIPETCSDCFFCIHMQSDVDVRKNRLKDIRVHDQNGVRSNEQLIIDRIWK